MILHVARPPQVLAEAPGAHGVLEFRENLGDGLVQDVHQYVQPRAVAHADNHVLDACLRSRADDFIEQRHEHVQAFNRESRLPRKRAVEKLLEDLDLGQPFQ